MHAIHDAPPAPLRAGDRGSHAASPPDAERVREIFALDGRSDLWTGLARMGGVLPAPGHTDPDPWALLRGWKHAPGGGGADGGLVRAIGGAHLSAGYRFDAAVPPGGYAWWYIDALSDDGAHGLTIIAFIGSVFSPYYKRSGRGDPLNHSSLNVALYGPRARWAMTERPGAAVVQERETLAIGPSTMRWTGDALEIDIVERDKRLFNPWQRPVRGTIRVMPEALNTVSFGLDPNARHRWHCLAPRARIEVEMKEPGLSWKGGAYCDSNFGDESLEEGFRRWHWSRAHGSAGSVVNYEGVRRDGSHFASALRFARDGTPEPAEPAMVAPLPNTFWQVERKTRSDRGDARVVKTWEDTPFYARSALSTQLYGERMMAVQESLDLDRYASPIVQFMLPFRMPRSRG